MLPPLILRLFRRPPRRANYSTDASDAMRVFWNRMFWELEREREEREERERGQHRESELY